MSLWQHGCPLVPSDPIAMAIRAWFYPPRSYNRAMPLPLTPRERAHLKARAHPLEPVVHVGNAGLADTVAAELDRALTAHELIKVRVTAPDRAAREALCDEICARTDAAEVQRVGKVLVLWRPRPEEPRTDPVRD